MRHIINKQNTIGDMLLSAESNWKSRSFHVDGTNKIISVKVDEK